MKGMFTVAVLVLAPATYASSEIYTERDLIGVRCEARDASGLTGTGFGRGGNYDEACNRAAAEAFTNCSGQYYEGSFPACTSGGGWRDRVDERIDERDDVELTYQRQPFDANWRSCIAYMYCRR